MPSTMVMRVPRRAKKSAISRPMAPPPTTIRLSGASVTSSSAVESSTAAPSAARPGKLAGVEPVATIRVPQPSRVSCVAPSACVAMTANSPSASPCRPLVTRPTPAYTAMPAAFRRFSSAWRVPLTYLSLRCCRAGRSKAMCPSAAFSFFCVSSSGWAAVAPSSSLVGMHPRFRQVPPRPSRSTSATESPRAAASKAARLPPGPPPSMIMS